MKNTDQELADSTLKVIKRHGWYLTEQVVPFSLFSENLSVDEKSELAAMLLTFNSARLQSYTLGKPKFPLVDNSTSLKDLLGPKGFLIWDILMLDGSWLQQSPNDWESSESCSMVLSAAGKCIQL